MPTLLTAGGLTVGAQIVSATDGAITIQSGPDGSKVNALAIDASGNTTAVAVNGTTMQQGGIAMPRMVLSTAQNTTSGTSIDFTSIPSWVRRITVLFNFVSTNGTSNLQVQIGAGSVTTTGYNTFAAQVTTGGTGGISATSGFILTTGVSAASTLFGSLVLTNIGSNLWVGSLAAGGTDSTPNPVGRSGGGSLSLGGTLDRVRLTTVNGTDTFDGGSVNILYEG